MLLFHQENGNGKPLPKILAKKTVGTTQDIKSAEKKEETHYHEFDFFYRTYIYKIIDFCIKKRLSGLVYLDLEIFLFAF